MSDPTVLHALFMQAYWAGCLTGFALGVGLAVAGLVVLRA